MTARTDRNPTLVPAWLPAPALLGTLCLALMILLGVLVPRTHGNRLDTAVARAVGVVLAGHPRLTMLLGLPSDTPVIVALGLAAACWLLVRGRRELAVLTVVVPVLCVVLVDLIAKPAFGRYFQTYLSYPSGHTTALISTMTVPLLAALAADRRVWRVLALACFGVLGALCMLLLVDRHYHYFTDTLGGALFGFGTVVLLCTATTRVRALHLPDQEDADTPPAAPSAPV
ncbi:MAG: phosphatase PAP2 family protein [Sciscionella sp.]